MKLISVLGWILASVGCQSYIEIFDVSAQPGGQEEVVVHFRAQRDVTRSAQFIGADLEVRPGAAGRVSGSEDIGFDKLVCVEKKTDAPGSSYAFEARFPLQGRERNRDGSISTRRPLLYDLTLPGRYELVFRAYGGMCGGPGGFYTNDVTFEYIVP